MPIAGYVQQEESGLISLWIFKGLKFQIQRSCKGAGLLKGHSLWFYLVLPSPPTILHGLSRQPCIHFSEVNSFRGRLP